jgi:RimJ/RimL family protein N-acetyltransferase
MANGKKAAPEAVKLRPWTAADAEALIQIASDREVWLNQRDRFPYPLTIPAAQLWLADRLVESPRMTFAVTLDGKLVGGVSLRRREDVHHICADLSFWVGKPFWNQGIATAAVNLAVEYAFNTVGLERLQVFVIDWTQAPAKVLQHCGFELEGRLRRYVLRDGRYGDALLYAKIRGS